MKKPYSIRCQLARANILRQELSKIQIRDRKYNRALKLYRISMRQIAKLEQHLVSIQRHRAMTRHIS